MERKDKLKLIFFLAVMGICYMLIDLFISASVTQSNPWKGFLILSFGSFLMLFILIVVLCVFLLLPFMEVEESGRPDENP